MKTLLLLLTCLVTTTLGAENKAKDQFEKLAAGNFSLYKAGVFTGWSMKSEDGNTYLQAFLNVEASKIEEIGLDAVPVAIKYLKHPHMHIRYIAAESLKRITKQEPIWYAFGTPGEVFNGNKTWSDQAIKEWENWYKTQAEQGGAGQPATRSESK